MKTLGKLDITRNECGATLRIRGSIYADDAPSVRAEMAALLGEGVYSLTLDLAKMDYIDSTGLSTLISIHKRCLQKGGGMKITGLRGMVKELFHLAKLDTFFTIIADCEHGADIK